MASRSWCEVCGKDIRLKKYKDGSYSNPGFDCPGDDHSFCSDVCYKKTDCYEFFGPKNN